MTESEPCPARNALTLGSVIALGLALVPTPGEAVPAFARQFGVKCTTCHTPVPPRLNNLGITFKRLGFRMPDADEQGKLILKDKPSRSASDDFSVIADSRAEAHRGEDTAFKVDEVMAMGAGAVGSHLSYMVEANWEDGAFNLEAAEGQILLGRPSANVTARFGMLMPLLWEKGGDTRLGIAEALPFATPVPVGEFGGSALSEMRVGAELGFNLNRLVEGSSRNTFVAVGVFNRLRPEGGMAGEGETPGDNGLKDVLVQALQLFGESNTIGALWYHGKVVGIPAEGFQVETDRWAIMGNYRFKTGTDIVGTVSFGRDTSTDPEVGRVKSLGWFVQVDQTIGSRVVASVRYDRFEPNRSVSALDIRGPAVALTYHALDNLILTAEYQGLRTGDEVRSRDFIVRAVVAY